jgi:hypothetical protein
VRLAALALVLLAFGAACGSAEEQSAPPETATTEAAASARPPAPAISGESLDGEPIALGDLRGRPVLINVWSSW